MPAAHLPDSLFSLASAVIGNRYHANPFEEMVTLNGRRTSSIATGAEACGKALDRRVFQENYLY